MDQKSLIALSLAIVEDLLAIVVFAAELCFLLYVIFKEKRLNCYLSNQIIHIK
jgi:hypothetical protein